MGVPKYGPVGDCLDDSDCKDGFMCEKLEKDKNFCKERGWCDPNGNKYQEKCVEGKTCTLTKSKRTASWIDYCV